MDPAKTVIVIRSLVPGGVAEQDGRLLPGDRLMYVNSTDLENASLEEAVQALKGAALGKVQIGVAKPLPVRISSSKTLLLQSFPFKPVGGGEFDTGIFFFFSPHDNRKREKREVALLRRYQACCHISLKISVTLTRRQTSPSSPVARVHLTEGLNFSCGKAE